MSQTPVLAKIKNPDGSAIADASDVTYSDLNTLLNATTSQAAVAALAQGANLNIRTLRSYGADGDETDDRTELIAALADAAANDVVLIGEDRTYGVNGRLDLLSNLTIVGATFKQLSPGGSSARTLFGENRDNVNLIDVKVDRNAARTDGSLSDAAGIWISGGSNYRLSGVEVFGNATNDGGGYGRGVLMVNVDQVTVERCLVRDTYYDIFDGSAVITDDVAEGFSFQGCTNLFVEKSRTERIQPFSPRYNSTFYGYYRFSRGFAVSGCRGFVMSQLYAEKVDQGVDVSGGPAGNSFGGIVDSVTWLTESHGFKAANSQHNMTFLNCQAYKAGYRSFTVNPNDNLADDRTEHLRFINCRAHGINTRSFFYQNNLNTTNFFSLVGGESLSNNAERHIRYTDFIYCDGLDLRVPITSMSGGSGTGNNITLTMQRDFDVDFSIDADTDGEVLTLRSTGITALDYDTNSGTQFTVKSFTRNRSTGSCTIELDSTSAISISGYVANAGYVALQPYYGVFDQSVIADTAENNRFIGGRILGFLSAESSGPIEMTSGGGGSANSIGDSVTGVVADITNETLTETVNSSVVRRVATNGNVGYGGSHTPDAANHFRYDVAGSANGGSPGADLLQVSQVAALFQNRNATNARTGFAFVTGGVDISDDRYAAFMAEGGTSPYFSMWISNGTTPTRSINFGRAYIDLLTNNGEVRINGTKVLGEQGAAVSDVTVTASTGSLPTADNALTIADAAAPTTVELLEYCTELKGQVDTLKARLEAHGLIATSS